jgi:sugar lactone lactonase YvrE
LRSWKLLVLGVVAGAGLTAPAFAGLGISRDEVVVSAFDGSVHRVVPTSGTVGVISENGQFNVPFNVAISPDGQSVYVADQNAAGGTIFRIDEPSGNQNVVVSGNSIMAVNGIVFGPDGYLYATRRSGPAGAAGIVRVDAGSGAVTPVSLGGNFDWPRDLEFASDGALYVLEVLYNDGSGTGASGALIRVNLLNGAQAIVSSGQFFRQVQGFGSSADGKFYVAQFEAFAQVVQVDGATGVQAIVTQDILLCTPRDVAVERTGDLLVSDGCAEVPCGAGGCYGPAVIRVDRTSGTQTVFTSGNELGDVSGLVIYHGGSVTPAVPTSWGRIKAVYR